MKNCKIYNQTLRVIKIYAQILIFFQDYFMNIHNKY